MSSLLSLAHEIVHGILTQVQPSDLAALSKTCKGLNSYISNNRILWKEIYLRNFDEPPKKASQDETEWEEELKKIVSFQKLCDSEDVELKRKNIGIVCSTALQLLSTASPDHSTSLNVAFLTPIFDTAQNSSIFLFSSSLFLAAGDEDQYPARTPEARQLSAQLHTCFGTAKEVGGRTRSRAAHPWARAKVYDLRRYTSENCWGPFNDDGSMQADWEKVEAIMCVLGYNLSMYGQRCAPGFAPVWDIPFEGVTPNTYIPLARNKDELETEVAKVGNSLFLQPDLPLDAMDPYGVSGTWRRVVCFLDYNDLYAFNFSTMIPDAHDRPPITTQEAIRLITMKLKVTRIEQPGPEDGQDLPIVHFEGNSRSMHQSWDPNATSGLHGTVRLTPNGDIRWTTLSIFHGEARWRSESVQVGGLRSARGSVGTWFDKDYDENGPAGPTAFWKLSDYVEQEEEGSKQYFLPSIFA